MAVEHRRPVYRGYNILDMGDVADVFDEDGERVNFRPVPMRVVNDYIDRHVSRAVSSIVSRAAIFAQGG